MQGCDWSHGGDHHYNANQSIGNIKEPECVFVIRAFDWPYGLFETSDQAVRTLTTNTSPTPNYTLKIKIAKYPPKCTVIEPAHEYLKHREGHDAKSRNRRTL